MQDSEIDTDDSLCGQRRALWIANSFPHSQLAKIVLKSYKISVDVVLVKSHENDISSLYNTLFFYALPLGD
jgi:hypothetical protein